jgi:drug/metabolite transporter (DMT)-like permease
VAVLSGVVMLAAETPSWSGILACAGALLYTGILSSAVGFTLQILGQQRLAPEPASLIMSLESVFGALAGWLIAGHSLGVYELVGCVLMFAAIVFAQLPAPKRSEKRDTI